MATAVDDSLLHHFRALEARLENEPEGVSGEIAVGVYMMSPRPRPKHGGVQVTLSSAETTDRGVKTEAYGTMGVGSLWLVDCERQRVETFTNVRGRMLAGTVFGLAESVAGDPFGAEPVPVAEILA